MTDDQYQTLKTKFTANDLTRLETQALFDECDRRGKLVRDIARMQPGTVGQISESANHFEDFKFARRAEMGGRV